MKGWKARNISNLQKRLDYLNKAIKENSDINNRMYHSRAECTALIWAINELRRIHADSMEVQSPVGADEGA